MLDCHSPGLAMQGRAASARHARTGAPWGEDFPSVTDLVSGSGTGEWKYLKFLVLSLSA